MGRAARKNGINKPMMVQYDNDDDECFFLMAHIYAEEKRQEPIGMQIMNRSEWEKCMCES